MEKDQSSATKTTQKQPSKLTLKLCVFAHF